MAIKSAGVLLGRVFKRFTACLTSLWSTFLKSVFLVKFGVQKPFSTQTQLFTSASDLEHPILYSLDDTEALLDWSEIEVLLSKIYSSKTGRPSYPLLTLFRGLMLGIWYQLSDVQLAQCLNRDLLFRKFSPLELGRSVPEASTLGPTR